MGRRRSSHDELEWATLNGTTAAGSRWHLLADGQLTSGATQKSSIGPHLYNGPWTSQFFTPVGIADEARVGKGGGLPFP